MHLAGLVLCLLSIAAGSSGVFAECSGNSCYDFNDPNLCLGLVDSNGSCRCGLRSEAGEETEDPRPAKENEVSWAGALFLDTKDNSSQPRFLCSVSLLSPRTVITAAHCTDSEFIKDGELFVSLGNTKAIYEEAQKGQLIKVDKIVSHPHYSRQLSFFSNDVAILILSEDVQLNDNVAPVCINWTEDSLHPIETNKSAMIAAWNGNEPSLKIYNVQLLSNEDCRQKLPENFSRFITKDKFCTSDSGLDLRSSGGGVMTNKSQGYYLSGLVNIRLRGNDMVAFIRTSDHLGWLRTSLFSLKMSRPSSV